MPNPNPITVGQDLINPKPLGYSEFVTAVRKAAEVYGERMFVVVGRGSLSATMPDAAASLRMTGDIDLFSPFNAERMDAWTEADRTVSVESAFFIEHGFYIERVGEWTLLSQPAGWQQRALALTIDDIEVLVIHPLDLAYNKLEAGRPKDIAFLREGLTSGAYKLADVEAFIREHAPDDSTRDLILTSLNLSLST